MSWMTHPFVAWAAVTAIVLSLLAILGSAAFAVWLIISPLGWWALGIPVIILLGGCAGWLLDR